MVAAAQAQASATSDQAHATYLAAVVGAIAVLVVAWLQVRQQTRTGRATLYSIATRIGFSIAMMEKAFERVLDLEQDVTINANRFVAEIERVEGRLRELPEVIEDADLANIGDNAMTLAQLVLADMRDGMRRDTGDTKAWQVQPMIRDFAVTAAEASERIEKALGRLRY